MPYRCTVCGWRGTEPDRWFALHVPNTNPPVRDWVGCPECAHEVEFFVDWKKPDPKGPQ